MTKERKIHTTPSGVKYRYATYKINGHKHEVKEYLPFPAVATRKSKTKSLPKEVEK